MKCSCVIKLIVEFNERNEYIMKRFSFVIPTYQGKVLVKNTLEALNYQVGYGRNDYEVVLIDDGSTDGTGEYIKGINKNYDLKYIYIDRTQESSRARARNNGWKSASGEIIVFIDADILVKKDYLKELDRCFSMDKDILVIGNRVMLSENIPYEAVCDRTILEKQFFTVNSSSQMEIRYYKFYRFSYNSSYQIYPWLNVFSCNMAVPKKWLDATGGFDENFRGWGLEDIEVGYNMYKNGIKIVFNNKLEVFHQNHAGSENLKISEKKFNDIDKNTRYFLKKYPDAINASERLIYKFFRGVVEIDMVPRQKLLCKRVTLKFKERNSLNDLKKTIIELSGKKGIKLKVIDYLEDTDLDIWIQLLGKRVSTPLYIPISAKKEFQRLMGFAGRFWFMLFRVNNALKTRFRLVN